MSILNKFQLPRRYQNLLTAIAKKSKQDFQLLTVNITRDQPLPIKSKQKLIHNQTISQNQLSNNKINQQKQDEILKIKIKNQLSPLYKRQQQKFQNLIRRKKNIEDALQMKKRQQKLIKSVRYQKKESEQANPEEYKSKINQLATSIRKRVKKINVQLDPINHHSIGSIKNNQNDPQTAKSYKTGFLMKNSRIFNTQEKINQSRLNFDEINQKPQTQSLQKFCKKFIMAVVKTAIKQGQQKLNHSFKFDTVKHKYPVTVFRKRILNQKSNRAKLQEQKIHQRQIILNKRKYLYQQSRKRCHKNASALTNYSHLQD